MNKTQHSILRRVLRQTRKYNGWFVGLILIIIFVAITDAYFPFLIAQLLDDGVLPGNNAVIQQTLGIYLSIILLQAIIYHGLYKFLVEILEERIRFDLRGAAFRHVQTLSLSYLDRTPVGQLMATITADTDQIGFLLTRGLLVIIWDFFFILSAIYFMALLSWQLTIVMVISVPVLVLVASFARRRIIGEFRRVRQINAELTGALNENLMGVRVVKAYTNEAPRLRDFCATADRMYNASYRAAIASALFQPAVQLILALDLGIVIWYGGWQVQYGLFSIGGIQAFIKYATTLLEPVRDLARIYADMQHSTAAAERYYALVDRQPETTSGIMPETLRHDIVFDAVSFAYEANSPVLSDVSLTIRKGEKIALVGATGGGKTTFINLLCRFYEPSSGTIRMKGQPHTDFDRHAYQARFGVVLQVPHLFSGTIRENIRYGDLEATEAMIEAAAKATGAHKLIVKLDKQYDSAVGEGGNQLSVGQKQLISLTRAVLVEPDIFVMDEATSAIDPFTESLIQEGLNTLMRDRTSIIIAHRLETVKKVDRIIVIDQGQIMESGTHAELMHAKGHYYRLYSKVFRRQLEASYQDITKATMPI